MVKISNSGLISSNLVDWLIFGKFIINMKLLKTQSILLIKYSTYSPIPWLKRRVIDDMFKLFWVDLLGQQKINYDLLRNCSDEDIKLFEKIVIKASLSNDLNYQPVQSILSQTIERFNILRGEIIAHNDNPDIINELKLVIDKLINFGKIQPDDKSEIIEDLENYINENKKNNI